MLESLDEVFATSTDGGIMPISKINNKILGKGIFGKITKKLYQIQWEKHTNPNWSDSINVFQIARFNSPLTINHPPSLKI